MYNSTFYYAEHLRGPEHLRGRVDYPAECVR